MLAARTSEDGGGGAPHPRPRPSPAFLPTLPGLKLGGWEIETRETGRKRKREMLREIKCFKIRDMDEDWTGFLPVHTYSLVLINWAIEREGERERDKQREEEIQRDRKKTTEPKNRKSEYDCRWGGEREKKRKKTTEPEVERVTMIGRTVKWEGEREKKRRWESECDSTYAREREKRKEKKLIPKIVDTMFFSNT